MAKKAKSIQQPGATQRSRNELRVAAARRRRNQNLLWLVAGAILVVLVVLLVALNLRRQQPIVGEQTFPSQGNLHIEEGSISPIAYNSAPPTSGPHYSNIVPWGIHDEPQRYEQLVHNLEDGGVVLYYQCEDGCPEVVEQLKELVEPYRQAGRHVVLAPNDPAWAIGDSQPLHRDMGARIAVAAWQRLLTLDEIEADKIRAFIERYEGVDHHAGS
jgi:hypothetical protein